MEGNSMKVALLNVGELRLENDGENKFNELCIFLAKEKFDICFLQETHVSGEKIPKLSETCVYKAYWSAGHWEAVNQAGAAILIRNTLQAEKKDLFTTEKQMKDLEAERRDLEEKQMECTKISTCEELIKSAIESPKIAFNTHIIAVELKIETVNILLVSIYVPPSDHWPGEINGEDFSEKQESRYHLFYKPFLTCLDGWTGNGVIVAGDMNDFTTRYKNNANVKPEWNIFEQLTERGFDAKMKGACFPAYGNKRRWRWNYAYYNKKNEFIKVRYDYIFTKNITRVKENEKAFRVLVRRENQTPTQSQDHVLQLNTIQIKDDDLVPLYEKGEYCLPLSLLSSNWDKIEIPEGQLEQSNGEGKKCYLPHSLLSSEFELPEQIDKSQPGVEELSQAVKEKMKL